MDEPTRELRREPATRPLPIPPKTVRGRRFGRFAGASARVRITGWLVLLMASGLTTVVLLVRQFLLADLDERVNGMLEQEATEFRNFAAAGQDPLTGQALSEPAELLDAHLRSQYPDRADFLLGITRNPETVLLQAHDTTRQAHLDDAVVREILTDPRPTGTSTTGSGEIRWVKLDVLPAASTEETPTAWFVAGYLLQPDRAGVGATLRTLLLVSALALVLTCGVAWLIAGQILAPVRAVRTAAAELTERDLTRRIPVTGRDDIAALAEQFNAMLDRLEAAFATHRQFLDDAGHELRTPITIVRGHLELLGDDPAERAEVQRICTDELDRMSRIVNDLLLLAKAERPDFLHPEPVSVSVLTSDIDLKARAMADRRWVLEAIGEDVVRLDPQRVTQAMLQLADNAIKHTNDGDEIRIGSSQAGGLVSFWVTDTGPGVRPEDQEAIFQRFGKASEGPRRPGAGLGLAIVRAIAEAHHGRAGLVSTPDRGATFVLELPAHRPDPTPEGAR